MDPFDSYKIYNALKLHFETDSYDAIKYNYKSNVTSNSFLKRRDKYFFAKIGKNYEKDVIGYYVSNFKQGVSYVGDMMNHEGEDNYNNYKRIRESIHRVFSIDINKLSDVNEVGFDGLFQSKEGQIPLIIELLMQEEISLETVCILDSMLGFVERESNKISDTIMWPDLKRRIKKYTPFVNFDGNKCKNLLRKGFTTA
jgi:hypothetical protein